MNENILIPYDGGMIELAKATKFTGTDRMTGQPQEIELHNRIVLTYGRQKVTLSGAMVEAIARIYPKNKEFQDWCKLCK